MMKPTLSILNLVKMMKSTLIEYIKPCQDDETNPEYIKHCLDDETLRITNLVYMMVETNPEYNKPCLDDETLNILNLV